MGVAGAGAAVATGGTGLALKKLAKTMPKRKIKRNAEIYNNYLPEGNSDIIKLFAQLVSLSMTKKLQTALIPQEKPSVLNPMLKVMDNAIDEIARVRKISRQDEKEAVQKLANTEFSEIWDIFKAFTRDNAQYALFKETSWAKTITNLLASHCDLGDPNDKSEIVSIRERNTLWINIFARYLEGKDEAVRESVLSTLSSKFNVIPELPLSNIPSSASLSSQCSSSSGIGSNDSYTSQTRESHSPQFFARKAEILAVNQPEPEPSLNLNTRL
ncbi:hypothetical protein [Rickettsiella endosymbiont of Dermanyssus gallinae]|uniref:hypothetical protein n=1 Tax=Rickettsiella endosymbiont of Dermanyssus gallinae TaxID=2856608 RepID=UPI001C52B642|nr:hypothetical protein [Rickettsiella endosymbiont of Dermanyssus gallinae]